jgi:tetratricopeptide (TPR) repeat protein
MSPIRLRHEQPSNDRDFEILCLRLLRKHWNLPSLELYGRRGQKQDGVDLLDTGGTKPLRAAQCKRLDPTKAIDPLEIRGEVAKARRFRPTLDYYAILTTAQISTEAQKEVARINRYHRAKGLFEVKLISWHDIEILLDENPEVIDVTYGQVRVDRSLEGRTEQALADSLVRQASAGTSDGDIEEAKAYLLNHEYQLSRLLFQRIRTQKWDVLTPRQKFRVLTNIGAAYLAEGNTRDAIPLFLDAKTYQPNDEHALANEILAYVLSGESEKAFTLATSARQRYPFSGLILSNYLRAAPVEMSLDALEKDIPPALAKDADVAMALAERAMDRLMFDRAVELSQIAIAARPEWIHARVIFGEATLRSELSKTLGDSIESKDSEGSAKLRRAEEELNTAIEGAHSQKAEQTEGVALVIRAEIRRLLGQADEADQDVKTAMRISPRNPTALREHARLLARNGNREESIAELREALALAEGREDITILLATTLRGAGNIGESQEAAQLFIQVAERPSKQPDGFREHVIWAALETLREIGHLDQSGSFLDRVPNGTISMLGMKIFRSKYALLISDRENASKLADDALALVDGSSANEDLRLLALLLSDLGRYQDALPLWNRLASRTSLTPDTRRLVDCAARLKKDDIVLQVSAELRNAGVYEPELILYETSRLRVYDPERAVRVLQDYLSRAPNSPNNRLIRLQLSSLGIELNKAELISADEDAMPKPEEVPASNWVLLVTVVAQGAGAMAAVTYAYKLLREHFSEPEAHRAYLSTFLPVERRPNIPECEIAGPGVAICFVENGTDQEQWRIIEEQYAADGQLNEIAPDHFLAKQVSGKRKGDSFLLTEPGPRSRGAILKQLLSKFIYRYQDCLQSWQVRFPDEPGVEMIRLPPPESLTGNPEIDLAPILASIDERAKAIEEAVEVYLTKNVPLHVLGSWFGQNSFSALSYLVTRPDAKVKCCLGAIDERIAAIEAAQVSNSIVLDLSAIATLALLDLVGLLEKSSFPIIVSRATMVELEEIAAAAEQSLDEQGRFGKHDGRYFLAEETNEQKQERLQHIQKLINAVRRSCQIVVCPSLAALEPGKRELLVKSFGQYGAESIVLAAEPGKLLWCDDFVMSGLAKTEFGIKRVWSQIYLQLLANTGTLDLKVSFEASAKLAGCGYYFASLDASTVMAACSLSDCDPDRWPLKRTLECFADEAVPPMDAIRLTAEFLGMLFRDRFPELGQRVLGRILDHMGKRNNGAKMVGALRSLLRESMGLNIIGLQAADSTIAHWLSRHDQGR